MNLVFRFVTPALLALVCLGEIRAQSSQAPAFNLPTQLEFAHQIGTASPPPQTFRVYSNPDAVAFTATVTTRSGGSWLLVNEALQYTGNTGIAGQQDLVISVDPIGIASFVSMRLQ